MVLDRSGSMDSARDDTIGGVNTFIDDQKSAEGEAVMTLALFDHEHSIVFADRDIQDVQHLTPADFVPRGSTALLDAIGRAIADLESKYGNMDAEHTPAILVNIITDGQENYSKEFNLETIRTKIEAKRAAGWEFVFLSADISTFSVGASMGIANNVAYSKSNTKASFTAYSASVKLARSTGRIDEDSLDTVNTMFLNSVDNTAGTSMAQLQGLKATAKAATALDIDAVAGATAQTLAERVKAAEKTKK